MSGLLTQSRSETGTAGAHCMFPSEILWRRGWESNPRIKVLQTSPLPLGYRADMFQAPFRPIRQAPHRRRGDEKLMERETGFEPATSTLARSHSTTELLPLERIPRL
jgi:hypothetical protein